MKITLDGVTRDLDLQHIRLRQGVAIQEFTGLPLADWQRALFSRDLDALAGTLTAAQAAEKATALTDPGWIVNMAAACWLMLAQNDEDPPPLDDDWDPDVLGFTAAFFSAATEEVKAKRVPDQPGPPVRPGRGSQPSRRTATPKRPAARQEDARDLPITGS